MGSKSWLQVIAVALLVFDCTLPLFADDESLVA
jgi:hypothetical protein